MLITWMLWGLSTLLGVWTDKIGRVVIVASLLACGALGARAWWIDEGAHRAAEAAARAAAASLDAAQAEALRERERIEAENAAQRKRDEQGLADAAQREADATRDRLRQEEAKKNDRNDYKPKPAQAVDPNVVRLDADWLRRERARSRPASH